MDPGTHTSDSIQVDASETAHSDFSISGSSFTGSGQSAVNVSVSGTGFATFDVHDNPLITTRAGKGVNIAVNGDSEMRGFIQDNPSMYSTVANNAGFGIDVVVDQTGKGVVDIDNNVITTQPGTPVNGFQGRIRAVARNPGTGELDVTIQNNTVNVANNPGVNGFEGLIVDSGNGSGGESNIVRLNLANNSIDDVNSLDYFFSQYPGNTFAIQGLTPSSGATQTQVSLGPVRDPGPMLFIGLVGKTAEESTPAWLVPPCAREDAPSMASRRWAGPPTCGNRTIARWRAASSTICAGEATVAFSVQDFHDLVRLLAERPEWRTQLRPLILTEELLALPAVVQRLAEAQERTEGRLGRLETAVAALAEAQQRTEREVRALAEAQRRTEERFDRIDQRFDGVDQHLGRLDQHVGELRGSDRERRYRDRASAYFGRLLRGVRVVAGPELDRLLDEGRTTGALDENTIDDVRWADLIVGGRRPGEDSDTYLVVEVSVALDADDVERAAGRAAALGRLWPTLAVVAGDRLTSEAAALAKARGVWQMLDGRLVEPGSPA